jgi:CO dehydrogenase maturation factor
MLAAVIGKGGVGKTTITALLLGRLLEAGQTPVLVVDADPSNCLGSALGIAVEKTLADLRETLRDRGSRPRSMTAAQWLALGAEEAIVENTGFDLLTMGRPEGKGCYCFVNNLIREHLERLSRSYRHTLVDCEAGLEHLSRRTSGRPDALICVTNRSRMAAETIRRSLALYRNLHGQLPSRLHLMLNEFEAGDPLAEEVSTLASAGMGAFSRVFAIPADPQIAAAESAGRSLLELSPATPAVAALRAWEIHA